MKQSINLLSAFRFSKKLKSSRIQTSLERLQSWDWNNDHVHSNIALHKSTCASYMPSFFSKALHEDFKSSEAYCGIAVSKMRSMTQDICFLSCKAYLGRGWCVGRSLLLQRNLSNLLCQMLHDASCISFLHLQVTSILQQYTMTPQVLL